MIMVMKKMQCNGNVIHYFQKKLTPSLLATMLLCKFGQNPSIGLQVIALERLISTFFMDS